ncbi:MAG TPA: feruloyl-CoA synthase [Deferrisomatales bacterium]|nr:feruloyl-CoA synthase [Deferrisomatales bacterium]
MSKAPRARLNLAPAAIEILPQEGGAQLLRSPVPLGPYPNSFGEHLRRWAAVAPERTFLAERAGDRGWRRVSYAEALTAARSIGQALIDRGLSPDRPVMILSENSLDHALLQLGCLYSGVPVAPLSPAYSLVSKDHAKLKFLYELVRPGLVYAGDGPRFAAALGALDLDGAELVVSSEAPEAFPATLFSSLSATVPTPAVDAAFDAVGPDTIAKILFTSGSTDMPKGVINTHRMLCASQQSIAQIWPFLEDKPPVLLDWLPWNHTFGGNKSFNLVLRNGGTLYIDAGKPMPGAIETTIHNLREVSPTISFNVPKGYDALLPYLEQDAAVRDSFFRDLDMIFYAAAALPQNLWERLEKLAMQVRGEPVFMASGWGATETSPVITMVHYPIDRAGIIGLPMPGFEVKMVPNEGKLEMRVRGPNVTPGYYRRPDLTAKAFDPEGFYQIGDAGRFADPEDPAKGLVFDGRVTEDFKLTTGTWVQVGSLRLGALDAAAPLLQDAVITGHDRDYIGILAWPNLPECRKLAGLETADPEAVVRAPAVVEALRKALQGRNAGQKGSSTRINRVLLLVEPPSLDANEITDKGYINQRATLENRAHLVARLYAQPPTTDVIVL